VRVRYPLIWEQRFERVRQRKRKKKRQRRRRRRRKRKRKRKKKRKRQRRRRRKRQRKRKRKRKRGPPELVYGISGYTPFSDTLCCFGGVMAILVGLGCHCI